MSVPVGPCVDETKAMGSAWEMQTQGTGWQGLGALTAQLYSHGV